MLESGFVEMKLKHVWGRRAAGRCLGKVGGMMLVRPAPWPHLLFWLLAGFCQHNNIGFSTNWNFRNRFRSGRGAWIPTDKVRIKIFSIQMLPNNANNLYFILTLRISYSCYTQTHWEHHPQNYVLSNRRCEARDQTLNRSGRPQARSRGPQTSYTSSMNKKQSID